jgi:hypothetical protein
MFFTILVCCNPSNNKNRYRKLGVDVTPILNNCLKGGRGDTDKLWEKSVLLMSLLILVIASLKE